MSLISCCLSFLTTHLLLSSALLFRYTLATWIPKGTFEQFRRLANVYFLGISVMMSKYWRGGGMSPVPSAVIGKKGANMQMLGMGMYVLLCFLSFSTSHATATVLVHAVCACCASTVVVACSRLDPRVFLQSPLLKPSNSHWDIHGSLRELHSVLHHARAAHHHHRLHPREGRAGRQEAP